MPVNPSFEPSYYQKLDFWIFLLLGIAGLLFSILSFVQAKKAKIAAENAGKIVKIQDVLRDISEIIHMCILDVNDDYRKASERMKIISGRIGYIAAILKNEINLDINELDNISETLRTIRDKLNTLNPIIVLGINDSEQQGFPVIYYSLDPLLVSLNDQMNRLSGDLHRHIINAPK